MNKDAQSHAAASEDIDLLVLLERVILFFRKFRWLFIIAILAGLAIGYYFYRSIPRTYRSKMLLHSFILTNPEEIQIVKSWNELLSKNEHATLAARLHCNKDILPYVKRIKAAEVQQVFTEQNPHGFLVDVLVTDNSVLPGLQAGLVYGFNNSLYIKEKLARKKEDFLLMIAKTEGEITRLDSTKMMLEAMISGRMKNPPGLIIDMSTLNKQLIEMNEKLLQYKESLEFLSGVQVLQGFESFERPSGPHLLPWLFIGLVFSICMAFAFALISSINTKVKRRARQKQSEQAG